MSVQLSRDASLATFVDEGGLVAVSSLADGYRPAAFDPGAGVVLAARVDPDGARLVSADGAKIRAWRLPGLAAGSQDFGDVSAVAAAPGGDFAVLGYRNGQVRFLGGISASVERGNLSGANYFGHRGVVTSLTVNARGNLAASGGSDGLVRVWDTVTGRPHPYLMRHPSGPIGALAFSSDDRWIVSAGPRSARVFAIETGTLANEIAVDGDALAVAFAPNGDLVAVGDSTGKIYLVAPDGTAGVQTIRWRSPINVLAFADTSAVLASGSGDGNLILGDTLQGTAIEGAYPFSGPIRWIRFGPDAEQVQLQSGPWLYNLDRARSSPAVTASTLLPARLRTHSALAPIMPSRMRVFGTAGGGHLLLADLEFAAAGDSAERPGGAMLSPAAGATADAPIDARYWRRVLGLEHDPGNGNIRTLSP
jgi:WD40 repeat protein